MNENGRRVVAAAETLGWEVIPGHTGSDHIALVHPNGATYTCASTPSEYRGVKNAIAELERLSGNKLPRANHRRSRKKNETTGFSLLSAKRESARWHTEFDEAVANLLEKRDQLITNSRADAASGKRELICGLAENLRAISDIESRLRDEFHQPIESFDPYTLGEPA